jgi:hypothetical protein
VARLGYSPGDVRHIILTHLDVDHCGGLPDFPDAQVHVLAAELEAATAQAPSYRYRPAHWAHGPKWATYVPEPGEEWFGFTSIQPQGLTADIRLIPLGGHTAGHTGVAVRDGDRWLLHCGDAYYYHRELDPAPQPHPCSTSCRAAPRFTATCDWVTRPGCASSCETTATRSQSSAPTTPGNWITASTPGEDKQVVIWIQPGCRTGSVLSG